MIFLCQNDMICCHKKKAEGGETRYQITELGQAIFRSSFSPHVGLVVFRQTEEAMRSGQGGHEVG